MMIWVNGKWKESFMCNVFIGLTRIFSYKQNARDFKAEGIREGDYCYSAGGMQGVYTRGGLVLDLTNE